MLNVCPRDYTPRLQCLAASCFKNLQYQISDPQKVADIVEKMVMDAYAAVIAQNSDIALISVEVDPILIQSNKSAPEAVQLVWGYLGAQHQHHGEIINAQFVGHRFNKDYYVKRLSSKHLAVLTVSATELDAVVVCPEDLEVNHPFMWAIDRANAIGHSVM